MKVNKTHKASVFTLLFSDTNRLRELYNALSGAQYDESAKITVNTLRNAVFMDRINDLSFTINDKLVVLIEHQSTINPNMALRLLLYISRVYEKIIDNDKIYAGKKMIVPRPEFIVLYNGVEEYPAKSTIKLSEHFEIVENHAAEDLELIVKVYNINKDSNKELERRSGTLAGYGEFVAKVRENQCAGQDAGRAVQEAVKWCIGQGYLAEFFKEHSSEVVNMLLVDWNWDRALAVRYGEGLEDGREQGREEGRQEGRQQQWETARKLKGLGLLPEQITDSTGLSAQDVAAL